MYLKRNYLNTSDKQGLAITYKTGYYRVFLYNYKLRNSQIMNIFTICGNIRFIQVLLSPADKFINTKYRRKCLWLIITANFQGKLPDNLLPRFRKIQIEINNVWSNLWDGGPYYWRLDVNSREHEDLVWKGKKLTIDIVFDPQNEEELQDLEILAYELQEIDKERGRREDKYREYQNDIPEI